MTVRPKVRRRGGVEITTTYRPRSRAAWRAWLAHNGARRKELWVLRAKVHVAGRWPTYDDLVEEALCHGWIDGIAKRWDDAFEAIRFTPRRPGSVWSPSNRRRVARLTRLGLMTAAGRAAVREGKRSGQWAAAARREEAPPFPADLAAALARVGARGGFDAFPPSHRKLLLRWLADAKRQETRKRRLAKIAEAARRGRRIFT